MSPPNEWAHQRRPVEAGVVHQRQHVGDVLLDVPRRVPRRVAVAPQVGGDHADAGQLLLGEAAVAERRCS